MNGRSRGFQDKAKASSKRLWPGQSPSDALWSYILWITQKMKSRETWGNGGDKARVLYG